MNAGPRPELTAPILEVTDLVVRFPTDDGVVHAVDGVSFTLRAGESLGVVGESGSGKSVSWLAVIGLLDRERTEISGSVRLDGVELLTMGANEERRLRGSAISMIFQDPMTSLHPYFRVGDQIAEGILAHEDVSKSEAAERAIEMLDRVAIPKPRERAREYPHQFSGGMRQRAMIAMALSLNPRVLIADEPTTALDVTVQAQILELIRELRRELGTSVVLISHDLGVVAEHCDEIAVMYAGRIVEQAPVEDLYATPRHPYTWGLLRSIPRMDEHDGRLVPIGGLPPSLIHVPSGCAYHPRCPFVFDRCREERPELLATHEESHVAACHLSESDKERLLTRTPEAAS